MSEEAKPSLEPMSDMKAKLRAKLMAKQKEREDAEAAERATRQAATDAYYADLKASSNAEGDCSSFSRISRRSRR